MHKQINELIGALSKHQSETEDTVKKRDKWIKPENKTY
jgi:hypothetical protein